MSRSPQTSSSTATLIETGRRVCRLCDQEGSIAQKYKVSILDAEQALRSSAGALQVKTFERVTCYDTLVLAESQLDDAVRATFYSCRKYDWNSGEIPILEKIFPDAVFSPVVQAPRNRKHDLIIRMIARLDSIGLNGNPLANEKEELEKALSKAVSAEELYEQSMHEESKARALEKLGKQEYVERYNAVYYQACSDLGRYVANRLFPTVRPSRKTAGSKPEVTGPAKAVETAAALAA